MVLVAPVIGLLERHGLQDRAETLIRRVRAATAGRVLLRYTAVRQISIRLGVNIGGRPQTVRPLVAPMAEAAARARHGELPEKTAEDIRAHAAAENVGNFSWRRYPHRGRGDFADEGVFRRAEDRGERVGDGVVGDSEGAGGVRGDGVADAGARPEGSAGGGEGAGRTEDAAMTLLTIEPFYGLCGGIFAFVAWRVAADAGHPKRVGTALFWALLAEVFLLGKWLPPLAVGYLLLAMVGLSATG